VGVGVIAFLSIKYTFMLSVPAGYMLGGTYLVLYYMGMVFASKNFKILNKTVHCCIAVVTLILVISWYMFIYHNNFAIDSKLPFGFGFNPPSVSLGIYGLLMGLFLFFAITLIECVDNVVVQTVIKILAKLGNYSLYIFLYHSLVRSIILRVLISNNIWVKRLILFPAMLLGPCIIKMAFDFCIHIYRTKIRVPIK
jgi:hypothetical protein